MSKNVLAHFKNLLNLKHSFDEPKHLKKKKESFFFSLVKQEENIKNV